jgi:alkylation response protein AidB-like acyl-CoA dehydrogenase
MATAVFQEQIQAQTDPFERVAGLLPLFAERCATHDDSEEFVAENFAELKRARMMSVAVPVELGGDGLDPVRLSELLRAMARACSSTALAFSMHTHVAAFLAWRWRNQKAPVDAVLRRISDEQIVLISSGGSDWLESSGTARKVDGGFVIDAVKGFASGVPAGAMINTSAVYDDPENGPTVVHFMVPLSAKEVSIEPNWCAMGMRGTGSHQVRINGFFVPDASIAAKRPRGQWHPLFHLIAIVAFPIIYSVYYGVAESIRDAALRAVKRRTITPQLVDLAGALDTELAAARVALDDMLAASYGQPGPESTNRIFQSRGNMGRALLATADKALELANGAAYLRHGSLERLFRDIQASRFHPLQPYAQRDFAGRMALGLPLDGAIV